MKKLGHIKLITLLEVLLIISSFVFIIKRAPYGFFFYDEPFVYTIAERLSFGDRLIRDEWNLAQNVGPIILPFYKVFHIFSNNNDGIILSFRFVFCILWFSTCLFVWFVFKKKYGYFAIFSYLYLIFFAPLDLSTLSYTSIGVISCIIISTIFFYHFEIKPFNNCFAFALILSIVICLLVLCCPYMAIPYFSLIAYCIISAEKRKTQKSYFFRRTCIISLELTICLSCIYVLQFILKKSSISDIFANISIILSGDAEHPPINLVLSLIKNAFAIFGMSRLFTMAVINAIVVGFYAKKNHYSESLILIAFLIATICYLRFQYKVCIWHDIGDYNTLNLQMAGIAILGLVAYILIKNKPKSLFFCFYIPGFIYSCMFSISSNTHMSGLSMPLSICGCSGIIIIALFLKDYYSNRNKRITQIIAFTIISVIITTQITSEVYLKLTRYYWDGCVTDMKYTIDSGAGKGLRTIYSRKREYEEMLLAYDELRNEIDYPPESKFLSLKFDPILYLDANLQFGTYSTWTHPFDTKRLKEYYSRNNDHLPDIVFSDIESNYLFNELFDSNEFEKHEYKGYFMYYRN